MNINHFGSKSIINAVANFFVHERLKIQRHIQNPVKYLRWSFLRKSLMAQNHLKLFLRKTRTCPPGFWIRVCMLLKNFLPTFRERNFAGKKMVELSNECLQIFGETTPNRLLHLPKTNLFIISLNKKTKWLKFLRISLLEAKKETYLLLN